MGFPVGYTELLFPKTFLGILSLLDLIRKSISFFLRILGLPDFLEANDVSWPDTPPPLYYDSTGFFPDDLGVSTAAAVLVDEFIPVMRFSELIRPPVECCAVCLYEFEGEDKIRRLKQCGHVFHRSCVDRWMMGYHRMTCPLCRTAIIPDALQGAFNRRVMDESGILELFSVSSLRV